MKTRGSIVLARGTLCGVAALLQIVAVPAAADGPSGCGATAPVSPYCTSGWHVFDSHHDEAEIYVEAYTGTIESTLRFAEGEWIYSCAFVAGVNRGCDQLGTAPTPGTIVSHTCDSYYVPVLYGGVGGYGCILK